MRTVIKLPKGHEDLGYIMASFMHNVRVCLRCDAPFTFEGNRAKYCSKSCAMGGRSKNSVKEPCIGCGKLGYWQSKANPEDKGRCRDCYPPRTLGQIYMSGDKQLLMDSIVENIKKVECIDQSPCWEWQGYTNNHGYGIIKLPRVKAENYHPCIAVYRAVMEIELGRTLEGYEPVHHECANRLCCNPEHLSVVTPEQNMAEMLERNFYLSRISVLEDVVADQQRQINELTAQLAALTERSESL